MSLRLASGRTVSELLAIVPDAECQLRQTLLQSHQNSALRQWADGTIEVDAWLPTRQITQILQEIAAHYLPKAALPQLDEQSAGSSLITTGRVNSNTQPGAGPPGWRHCSDRQLALTRSAVEIDLRQHLMMHLAGWRLSAYQTLGQLWGHRPDFRQAVRQQIKTLPLGEPIFEQTGLCRLPAEFGRAEIVTLLIRAAAGCEPSIEADLSQAIAPDFQDPLVLDGLAVAPPCDPASALSFDSGPKVQPQWVKRLLTTQQTSPPQSNITDPQARRTRAIITARIEAKRQLWIQIEQLTLPTGGTIGELLAASPGAPQAIAAIDAAMLPIGETIFDNVNGASVSLGIKLQIVWEIIRELQIQNEPVPQ